jgi:transcriptional regulator with XRE-family HTH domain
MDLAEAVRTARHAKGLTQERLAELAGVSRQAVNALERGGGRVATLEATLQHLNLKFTGLARGVTLADQVRATRERRKLTRERLAEMANISLPTLRNIEAGAGSLSSLSRVLKALAPTARPRKVRQAHWQDRGDSRFTPPWILKAVEEAFGRISIDPCWDPRSFVVADRYIDEKANGLTSQWSGQLAFVNPPFSDHSTWVRRANAAFAKKEVSVVVALLAARIETAAFHECVFTKADLVILKGKLRFHDEHGTLMTIAPFAALIAAWGASDGSVRRFAEQVGGTILWRAGAERCDAVKVGAPN